MKAEGKVHPIQKREKERDSLDNSTVQLSKEHTASGNFSSGRDSSAIFCYLIAPLSACNSTVAKVAIFPQFFARIEKEREREHFKHRRGCNNSVTTTTVEELKVQLRP